MKLRLVEEMQDKLLDLNSVRSMPKQKALDYMRKPLEEYSENDFRRIDAKIYKIKRSKIKQERAQGNLIAKSIEWN